MHGMSSHQSARMLKDEWLTPPEILHELGPFDLDPCAPANRPWSMANKHYTVNENGLAQEWFGMVWCNPPYGKEAASWLDRMADHGNGIALIFARTETKMFFDHVWSDAKAILFIEGRLHFHHADGTRAKTNSGAPSVLVAYGWKAAAKLANCNVRGRYINLKPER